MVVVCVVRSHMCARPPGRPSSLFPLCGGLSEATWYPDPPLGLLLKQLSALGKATKPTWKAFYPALCSLFSFFFFFNQHSSFTCLSSQIASFVFVRSNASKHTTPQCLFWFCFLNTPPFHFTCMFCLFFSVKGFSEAQRRGGSRFIYNYNIHVLLFLKWHEKWDGRPFCLWKAQWEEQQRGEHHPKKKHSPTIDSALPARLAEQIKPFPLPPKQSERVGCDEASSPSRLSGWWGDFFVW